MSIGIVKKIIFRLFRICTGRAGIYCKAGRGNRFNGHTFIHEMSEIGSYNYIGRDTMIANAKIGSYCSIAPGVKIGQAEHSVDYITTYSAISKKNTGYSLFKEPAVIGNDVWIGGNAVILQGVKIGDGAVIGANAVVTKDVPSYAIAAGVPAKIIRYRFDAKTIKRVRGSHWWKYDPEEAARIIKELEGSIL